MASIWKTKTSKTTGPMNQPKLKQGKNVTAKSVKQTKTAKTPGPLQQPTIAGPVKKNAATNTNPVGNGGYKLAGGFTSPGVPSGTGIQDINFDLYKTQSATIDDIAKKYGIDYSREYAKRQAEAEAQAKRSGLQGQQKQIDEGVRNAQDALSRDYFQKGLTQAQSNVNGGINAGLANESNLRLSMNRQGEMGEIMGQANLARNQVAQQLTDVETARIAQEEAIYNERLQEAIAVLQQDRSLDQSEKQYLLNAMLQQRGQNIDMSQFNQQMEWDKFLFNNVSATDKAQNDWQKYMFNNMSASDKAQLDWSKYQFGNMSAAEQEQNKLAWAQLEQEKSQFATEQQWREYEFNNMSASDKAQMKENQKQFGEEMAWRMYELDRTQEFALEEAGAGLDFLP